MRKGVLMVLSSLLTAACSVFGHESVETLPYTVLESDGAYELRAYSPFLTATTTVPQENFDEMDDAAFTRLFDYISGNNAAAEKIAMTAPVFMQKDGEKIAMTAPVLMEKAHAGWSMAFVLPSSFTLETAPRPLDPAVNVAQVPEYRAAAVRFSGFLNARSIAQNTAALLHWMESKDLTPAGSPQAAGYNPPWTIPSLRRNEVIVKVGE